MERKITILTWLVVLSMLLQVALFLLLALNLRSRAVDAYSRFGWGYWENCFDAGSNGPEVRECLGIPGPGSGSRDPYRYTN